MNICLFKEEEIDQPLSIRDERGEHIVKILHKKEGDSFTAGIINGIAGKATITKIQNEKIEFTFTGEKEGKRLYPLKLIVGFPRPIQLKRLLRDAAALGACEVHLTGTELGEKSYRQSNLLERGTAWKMLLDGTVQAGSTFVPELFMHNTLKDCIQSLGAEKSFELRLALDNISPSTSLTKALSAAKAKKSDRVVAAIGSERGWTNKERDYLEDNGFLRCGMGPRIMRTETAATVSMSVISAAFGWLE